MRADGDLLAELTDRCRQRWQPLGFSTRTVPAHGIDVHVAEAGSGPPVVLLHGYPQSGEIWRKVAAQLARHHQVIIPDLRGMGLSSIAAEGYELPDLAEDIHQLVNAIGYDNVEVIGHDWGAAVSACYALRYRGEVRRLVFIEGSLAGAGFEESWTFARPNAAMTFIPLLLSGELTEQLLTGREKLYLQHLWRTFTTNTQRSPFDSWAPYVAAMRRPGLIRSSANYYRAVYTGIARVRELLAAGKLEIPVLSIAGSGSLGALQLPLVEAFAANVVRHVVVGSAGHFIAEEQPEAFLAEVEPFLTSQAGSPAPVSY